MTTTHPTLESGARIEAVLNGPGASEITALVEAAFARAVGPQRATRVASLNMDMPGVLTSGEQVVATAWIERSTRTLFFVSADVRRASDQSVIAAASGVLCVLTNPGD